MRSSLTTLRAVFSALIFVSLVIWATWYVSTHQEQFAVVAQVSLLDLLFLYATFIVLLTCNGKIVQIVASAFGVRLKHLECLALSTASSFANYFLPFGGGIGLRGMYLWKLHRLPVTDFVSTLGAMGLMCVAVNGLLAMTGMAVVASVQGHTDVPLFAFFAFMSVVAVVLMTRNFRAGGGARRPAFKRFHQTLDGWRKLRGRADLMAKLGLTTLVFTLLSAWQCKLAFAAISVPLSWGGVLVYAACKNLAAVVSLTPGSLGIVEGVSIYLGTVLGYTTAQALLVQGLVRSVGISTLLIAGPLAILLLRRRLARVDRASPIPEEPVLG